MNNQKIREDLVPRIHRAANQVRNPINAWPRTSHCEASCCPHRPAFSKRYLPKCSSPCGGRTARKENLFEPRSMHPYRRPSGQWSAT